MNENDISNKLVNFCKENNTFRRDFVALFTNEKDVRDIDFTGNTETGYGKPDITISFSNGFRYYIEVKTRCCTGFQENQTSEKSGYAKLIKDNNQELKSSMGYLLDNNHDTSECLTETIVYWQKIWELVKDFNNLDLAKDIRQNVDGIETGDKLFGQDEELFANPYQLALFSNMVLGRPNGEHADNYWMFSNFLVPALEELGCTDISIFPYGDDEGNPSRHVGFVKDGKRIHLQFNYSTVWKGNDCIDENVLCHNYFFSFSFYRPWIMGVREATSERQMVELTKSAVKLWLIDLEKNILTGKWNSFESEEEYYSTGYLGEKADLYGNPFVFANAIDYLREGTEIYDEIVIPALKKIPEIKIKKKEYWDDWRYIIMTYGDIEFRFNIYNFWNSKRDTYVDNHSFIFYRPWIVGVHKAKTKTELIEYTRQAFELWIEDLKQDNYL